MQYAIAVPKSGQARVPRGTLNRETILRAALAVLDERGPDGLTIRSVADALGTKPMSLYSHIDGKEDLLEAMFEVILSEVQFPSAQTATWQDLFRLTASEFRKALLRHPAAIPVIHRRPQRATGAWLMMTEWSLAVLHNAGFDAETSVHAHRTLASLTIGATLNEAWYREQPTETDLLLPATGTPTLAKAASHFTSPDFDASFKFAIDTVIAGLERRLGARPVAGLKRRGAR